MHVQSCCFANLNLLLLYRSLCRRRRRCLSSLMSLADVGVTNRRPSSDSELISRMEMRLLACVTRGPSRKPYQTVSTVHLILGILRTDLWSQGSLVDYLTESKLMVTRLVLLKEESALIQLNFLTLICTLAGLCSGTTTASLQ